jgi:hypothetical protein
MKKGFVIGLALMFCFVFSAMVYGQQESQDVKAQFMQKLGLAKDVAFEGTVVAHDVLCHCMVVKVKDRNVTMNDDYTKFMQDYNNAKGLKIGAKVKGAYKVVSGINYLISLAYAE